MKELTCKFEIINKTITQEKIDKLFELQEFIKGFNFSHYDLSGLDFSNRDLRGTKFFKTNLTDTNFENSILLECNFYESNCTNSNFNNADLECADLSHSNLTNANFTNTDLTNADLDSTIITSTTNFTNAKGVEQICPLEGEFIGWKKCRDDRIVELLIPSDALRSNGNSPQCRCSKAKVLSVTSVDGKKNYSVAHSTWDRSFTYTIGETVESDSFDTNRFHECTHGIHFFMTRDEAVEYEM